MNKDHLKTLAAVVLVLVVAFLLASAYDAYAAEPDPEPWLGCSGYAWSGQPGIYNLSGCSKLHIGAECLRVNPLDIVNDPETGERILRFEVVELEGVGCQ